MKDFVDSNVHAAGILLLLGEEGNREFLLLRHADRWDLPKGHCEPGESYREAAMREAEEETGIPATEIRLDNRFVFEISYPVRSSRRENRQYLKTVHYFLGYLGSRPILRLTEHQDAQWFRWNPPHRIQTQTVDPLLEAVDRHLRSTLTQF